MTKKGKPAALILSMTLLLSALGGCIPDDAVEKAMDMQKEQLDKLEREYSESDEGRVGSMSRKITDMLEEGDRDGLSELFCEETRALPDFDGQLDALMEFMGGGDLSWSSRKSRPHLDDERLTGGDKNNRYFTPSIENIEWTLWEDHEVAEYKYYRISYRWQETCSDKPERVGIQQLTAELVNTGRSVVVGEVRE